MLQHLHSQVLAVAHLFCGSSLLQQPPPGDPADVLTRSTACLPPQATCSSCSGSPSNTDARIHVLHSRSPPTALLLRCQLTSLWQASQQRCLAALRCRPMQARQLVAAQRPGNADVAAFCAPAGVPNFSQQQAASRTTSSGSETGMFGHKVANERVLGSSACGLFALRGSLNGSFENSRAYVDRTQNDVFVVFQINVKGCSRQASDVGRSGQHSRGSTPSRRSSELLCTHGQ